METNKHKESKVKQKFNVSLARKIAGRQLTWVIGCAIGTHYPDWALYQDPKEMEHEFIKALESLGLMITERRIAIISEQYEYMRNKVLNMLDKHSGKIPTILI